MKFKYVLNVFVVILFILSMICFGNYILNKKIVESLSIPFSMEDAFCEKYSKSGSNLENECNTLTKDNCLSTSCCIWTSEKKCAAGNASGALFNTDSQGNTESLDYYFFKSKCYGTKCPDR